VGNRFFGNRLKFNIAFDTTAEEPLRLPMEGKFFEYFPYLLIHPVMTKSQKPPRILPAG